MEPIRILIVEDARATRDYLSELVQIIGYQAHSVEKKTEFVGALHGYDPDLLLLGSSYQGGQVKAFAEVLEREKQGTPILVLGDGSTPQECSGFSGTARISCLPRNFDSAELKRAIEALVTTSQASEYAELDKTIIGKTPVMMEMKRQIARLSTSDITVLITGESGTGKELAARAIHHLSARAKNPFIKVNTAALPANLLESELFGFEKGAFTGAFHKKPGKFELAHSGTIFLDEISELHLPLQAKLLQVLQDDEIPALGSIRNTMIDVRVLTATNADLGERVSDGRFRTDLYFRINVVALYIPPLRARKEDIPVLCEYFLRKYARQPQGEVQPFSNDTMELLHQYDWPGNVRELQNFIHGMVVLGDQGTFRGRAGNRRLVKQLSNGWRILPASRRSRNTNAGSVTKRPLKVVCKQAVREAETTAIVDVLFHTNWNRRKASELLQISYKALLGKIKEYGIKEHFRELPRKGDEVS